MRLVRSSSSSGWPARVLAILLLAGSITAVIAWPVQVAQADDDDDEDEGDDDDDGDDDDGGTEEEEEEEDAKDQPPITAGGLYTLKTYPIRELERPLTITEKILQTRIGLGVDVSAKGAFEQYGLNVDARYGFRDHVTGLVGFDNAYNFKQFAFYAGIEAALAYDFIDFRAAARISRPAIPSINASDPNRIDYEAGGVKASIDVGFPFRYKATKEVAIIALDTLISFDFNASEFMGVEVNGVKPDLNPSLGIATNPIAPVSIVLFAQLQVVDFDTTADNFVIPATARVQFSPNQKLDLGLEFTFLNVKPPEGKFYDNRFLLLYGQFRIGR
jgi:hypothetical protein